MYINTINTINEHHQTESCAELGYWTRATLTRIRVSQCTQFHIRLHKLFSDTRFILGHIHRYRTTIWIQKSNMEN